MAEWQDISTAPKNLEGEDIGPIVLVYNSADGFPWPAYYDPKHFWWGKGYGPAWVTPDYDPPIGIEYATHWMPLPEPPKEGE